MKRGRENNKTNETKRTHGAKNSTIHNSFDSKTFDLKLLSDRVMTVPAPPLPAHICSQL